MLKNLHFPLIVDPTAPGTPDAQPLPMHAVAFGLKRAFQGFLRISRPWFKIWNLTPARFDMLVAIHKKLPSTTIRQRELQQTLGVTAPTVSKMLDSLEDRGLVLRDRCPTDARQKVIELTQKGLRIIRDAIRETIDSGMARLIFESALTERYGDESEALMAVANADSLLTRVRDCFRDFATLYYPWHPDD